LAQLTLSQRERRTKKEGALLIELRQRVVTGSAVAVGPIVIAWREHGRSLERVEITQRLGINGIRALAATCLEIAIVDRERQALRIHIADQCGHTHLLDR